MDILAWGVLIVMYVFGVVPAIGSELGGHDYKEDLVLGGVIHLLVAACILSAFILIPVIVWAILQVAT